MPGKYGNFLDRLLQRRTVARWDRAAKLAPQMDLLELQRLRGDARLLRRDVDRVLHEADGRLAMSLADGDGLDRPFGCDWAWRPDVFGGPVRPAGFAPAPSRAALGDATLFHDCKEPELTLRQIRNPASSDATAPFGLHLDALRFDGSFLSLAIDLPAEGLEGLRRNHLLRVALDVDVERKVEIFCRFNVKYGPNTEQLVRELPLASGKSTVDFDLALTRMNEKRLEKAWVDLIFDGARMNRITLRDVTFARHPRAEI